MAAKLTSSFVNNSGTHLVYELTVLSHFTTGRHYTLHKALILMSKQASLHPRKKGTNIYNRPLIIALVVTTEVRDSG